MVNEKDEKVNILIVDDDENTCRSLALVFNKQGYETETAGSGQEALEKAKEREFNLALVDIKLPDMEGIDLLTPLREISPDIVLIIVTAYASVETAVRAPSKGATAYLAKPLDMIELTNVITEALQKQHLEWEKQQTEEALRESEERYRVTMECAPGYILVVDREGTIQYINRAFAGLSPEEICGSNVRDYSLPENQADMLEAIERAFESGVTQSYDIDVTGTDAGPACYETRVSPVIVGDRIESAVLHSVEITERKQLEAQLLQSQKMDAIGRLAGGIAHDFNNVLTVITGSAELILQKLPEESPHLDRILNIQKAAEHAAGLTQQLLAFGRKQIVSPCVLDVNEVVSDLHQMLERVIGEDIQVIIHMGEDVGNIFMDPGQLEQVLVNLLVNAREAMSKGGIVTIETEQVELDDTYVNTHPYFTPGPYARITVSDTGIGISDEIREKVFEPFFSTKESGSGLGLSTVYGIVKQNMGAINVYSEEGIGTTFKMYLPITEVSADTRPVEVDRGNILTGSETILVVEDEDTVRELAKELLTNLGYRVHICSNADEALLFTRDSGETVDLLLTDVVMPGKSGSNLADAVQKTYPSTRVLFMSGYTNNAIAHHGVLDEGVELLQKPFSMMDMATKVREVLDA